MYDIYLKVGVMVWITILIIWVMYVSASLQSHRERLTRLEKDKKV